MDIGQEDMIKNNFPSIGFVTSFLAETSEIIDLINKDDIAKLAQQLKIVRDKKGRLFILGVGGSASSASHAVNDFRKLAGFEAYAPTDNVSELTARTNDDGFESVFSEWLRGSNLRKEDALLIFSVGGGNEEKKISANLVKAIKYAREVGASVMGIVGRDGGYTAKEADVAVIIPVVNSAHVTPHTEGFTGIIWHLLVSSPLLKTAPTKWESVVACH